MRRALFKIYWAMRGVVAPGLNYSQLSYEAVLRQHTGPEVRWLDIGCGHQVLPTWRASQETQLVSNCKSVVGVDFDRPSLRSHRTIRFRAQADISRLPFPDGSFDLVTANMVVEHLDDPDTQFREAARVLRPGGVFIFHTPNANGYFAVLSGLVPEALKGVLIRVLDGRPREDVFKIHYKANTEAAVDRLAAASGLEVTELKLFLTDAVFALVPPLALAELALIRLLMMERLRRYRTNIIAVLRKRDIGTSGVSAAEKAEAREEHVAGSEVNASRELERTA